MYYEYKCNTSYDQLCKRCEYQRGGKKNAYIPKASGRRANRICESEDIIKISEVTKCWNVGVCDIASMFSIVVCQLGYRYVQYQLYWTNYYECAKFDDIWHVNYNKYILFQSNVHGDETVGSVTRVHARAVLQPAPAPPDSLLLLQTAWQVRCFIDGWCLFHLKIYVWVYDICSIDTDFIQNIMQRIMMHSINTILCTVLTTPTHLLPYNTCVLFLPVQHPILILVVSLVPYFHLFIPTSSEHQ